MFPILLAFLGWFAVGSAWLPASGQTKIRGVNLGSLFVLEPWMACDEWQAMKCGTCCGGDNCPPQSEFDCVLRLGQQAADATFQNHWSTWITRQDLLDMQKLGLNTIRVPVGYWINEALVDNSSEHFPRGGFNYLETLMGQASDLGMYIIMDLHGAPGAQVARNADTGQIAPFYGFYNAYNYERAFKFLEWMTNIIHTNNNFRNVGMLEVLNEPIQVSTDSAAAADMVKNYYPTAWSRIRAVEDQLNKGPSDRLHIQMMNEKWNSGDPNQDLHDLWFAAYDDHRYIKWAGVPQNRSAYLSTSCSDDRGGNFPVIVGEWSLSAGDDNNPADEGDEWGPEFDPTKADAVQWYRKWWAAQVIAYEKQQGWIFWSWKANWIGGRNDWRWSYQAATQAGVIPADPNQAYSMNACAGLRTPDRDAQAPLKDPNQAYSVNAGVGVSPSDTYAQAPLREL